MCARPVEFVLFHYLAKRSVILKSNAQCAGIEGTFVGFELLVFCLRLTLPNQSLRACCFCANTNRELNDRTGRHFVQMHFAGWSLQDLK